MRTYRPDASPLRFASPSVQYALLGLAAAVVAAPMWVLTIAFYNSGLMPYVPLLAKALLIATTGVSIITLISFALAVGFHFGFSAGDHIRFMVLRGLCCPAYGNPLHLNDGELLPIVTCHLISPGIFRLRVAPGGTNWEPITKLAENISASLRGRFRDYAVTLTDPDISFRYVEYRLENIRISRALTVHSVEEIRPVNSTELIVQKGTYIDLTTSGSMLFSGKTRSGKTTAIISLLLQVLLAGRDNYGSEVMIIDPKRAELSRLPYVVTLDKDGQAVGILDALRRFEQIIRNRQQALNDRSEDCGDAVHWWEAGMHPSLLFIDEYVACRSLFPQKGAKGSEDYCLATFDGLLKRIVTMGASAGCYVIVSIAEASVQEGGLPSMLRSAMSTRVLMQPTMPEGQLLWPTEKLEALKMSRRVYRPGDAWFSSTDGEHDDVSFVHFPHMKFRVYRELRRLLTEYYSV